MPTFSATVTCTLSTRSRFQMLFKDGVGGAKDQQVLDGLHAQVVVDPVDLLLVEVRVHDAVELARRAQVPAERLLDDQPRPSGAAAQPCLTQPGDRIRKRLRRQGEVEDPVAGKAMFALERRVACPDRS